MSLMTNYILNDEPESFVESRPFRESRGESRYFPKCKRLRTDGPTPCLCCPADCIGQYPGHTFAQALLAMDLAERGLNLHLPTDYAQALGAEPDPSRGRVVTTWQALVVAAVAVMFAAWLLWR